MIITIIAEPRSGSTNLANWFHFRKDFTVLFEPYNPDNPKLSDYQEVHPKEWKYRTKHFLIKEIYSNEKDFSKLLEISDKVIVLYRENDKEQLSSWKNAVITNNWDKKWVYNEKIDNYKPLGADYFFDLKEGIKQNFIDKDYFSISYEELYYNNGFQRVIDYLNIEGVENIGFPYGQKYRVNIDKPTSLI
jgi:hypothetical protein